MCWSIMHIHTWLDGRDRHTRQITLNALYALESMCSTVHFEFDTHSLVDTYPHASTSVALTAPMRSSNEINAFGAWTKWWITHTHTASSPSMGHIPSSLSPSAKNRQCNRTHWAPSTLQSVRTTITHTRYTRYDNEIAANVNNPNRCCVRR